MNSYLRMLQHVLDEGEWRGDRTGTGTKGVFGYEFRHMMSDGFPLLTTKKLHVKSIIHELLWFLRGETNIKSLQEVGVTIWDEWADKDGNLGPVYGKQWRAWEAITPKSKLAPEIWAGGPEGFPAITLIDQIAMLVKGLRENPFSRRHIVSAWNVADVADMKLPPCHMLFQCYVSANGENLSLRLDQRSADLFLGVPFNIASYALLLEMLAHVCGMQAGELIIHFGDLHIYSNHIEQVREQLRRAPRGLPILRIKGNVEEIDDFKFEDYEVLEYDPHPAIKAPVAV